MNISMEELNPFIDLVELNEEVFETTSFNLRMETWAYKYHGSLSNFIDELKKGDDVALAGCFYTLIKNKARGDTLLSITQKVLKKKALVRNHIITLIEDAQPRIKNPKRAKEIKEALGKTEDSEEENFAISFDKIAKRYGLDIDTFYTKTSRQIHALFKAADIEDYKSLEVKAALHGKKLKDRIKYHDFTEEEEAVHKEQADGVVERLRKRAEKMKNGK